MNDTFFMIIAFLTGLFLGGVFFAGLWFTIRKALTSKIPAVWFFGSFISRIGIVLAGFYLIIQPGELLNAFICLAGFISARFIVMRFTKSYEDQENGIQKPSLYLSKIFNATAHKQEKRQINILKKTNPLTKQTSHES